MLHLFFSLAASLGIGLSSEVGPANSRRRGRGRRFTGSGFSWMTSFSDRTRDAANPLPWFEQIFPSRMCTSKVRSGDDSILIRTSTVAVPGGLAGTRPRVCVYSRSRTVEVDVEPRPGAGGVLFFSFPLATDEAPEAEATGVANSGEVWPSQVQEETAREHVVRLGTPLEPYVGTRLGPFASGRVALQPFLQQWCRQWSGRL